MSKTKEEKQQIQLSNTGLSDIIKKVKKLNIDFAVGVDDLEFSITSILTNDEGPIFLTRATKDEFNNYISRLEKVIARNKILDTDKVFFTKNSEFPRTSFNRYSDKARRVEKIERADKIVVNKINTYVYGYGSGIDAILTKDGKESYLHLSLNVDEYSLRRMMRETNNSAILKKYSEFISANYSNYDRITLTKDFTTAIAKFLDKAGYSFDEIKFSKGLEYVFANHMSVKDLDALKILTSGEIPISKFCNDSAANAYINRFKSELDENTYKYILDSLKSPSTDPEVPMQLLAQSSIPDKTLLYAIFLNIDSSRRSAIKYHKVFNTVDVKNLVKDMNLDRFFRNNYQPRMDLINFELRRAKGHERKKLFYLVKDTVMTLVAEQLGLTTDEFNIEYEDIEV